ncbi:MBL fold metallo-hydrolase [bacterium]|nr:MBL fold metallo-hydrolase [bacterium]
MARAKPADTAKPRGAKPKPRKATKPKAAAAAVPTEPRVRMYRHGLGDGFLLTFPREKQRDFRVLIDCGIIQGTPQLKDQPDPLALVVADLVEETADPDTGKATIDVLVATHEHWDHLAGFATLTDKFKEFDFSRVWLAWTEDPKNPTARKLRRERAEKVNALKLGLDHTRAKFGVTGLGAADATGSDKAVVTELERVGEVLSFFGVDPDTGAGLGVTGDGDDLFGVKGKPRLSVSEAMDWCRTHAGAEFFTPGGIIDLTADVPGLRVYVLGPPTDPRQLFKDLPTKKGRETYEEEDAAFAAASGTFFGADLGQMGGATQAERAFDRSAPFDDKYRVSMTDAAGTDFFRTYYLGTGAGLGEEWRRIDEAGLAAVSAFALQLDSDTNNTSLALAFELGDPGEGQVLLFPGDAQVGNWESWHADPDDKPLVWHPAGTDGPAVTAKDLLERTVLYKTGHHGSHNATLRGKGLELMTHPDLVALVPVDSYVAREKKHWARMPFVPLMDALRKQAHGRVIVADQPLAAMKPKPAFPGTVADAPKHKALTVESDDQKLVTRPLYVDYTLPPA